MAVKFEDYYKTLGVGRDASAKKIQNAFRLRARKYHPDVNKDAAAVDKFKQINEAYEVLKDPKKRQRYDQLGENWQAGQDFTPPPGFGGNGFGGSNFSFNGMDGQQGGFRMDGGGQFSDFFENLFANQANGHPGTPGTPGQHQQPRRPANSEVDLTLTLEEIFHGGSRQLTVQGPTGNRQIDVKIPAGTTDSSKIRIKGQGNHGADIILKITIAPHSRFEVDGVNLTLELPLTVTEAALGAKIPVQTLDGEVTITIPPGTSSGSKLRLKNKGLTTKLKAKNCGSQKCKDDGCDDPAPSRGHLVIRTKIVVPKELTDEQRTLLEQLREVSTFDPRA